VKRSAGLLIAFALVASSCTALGGQPSGSRELKAEFSRAVQLFPGNSVRVLGVKVGRVLNVENTSDATEATFRIDDPDIKLPADVKATIIPVSLLGERYVQLFPAYEGGPTFDEEIIPQERTTVPAEQDELLQGLNEYFGAIDPDNVSEFVSNTAEIIEGNGEALNRLIDKGSSVIQTLASKKDSLAGLISELNTLTVTLSTRQSAIARVINSFNTVGRTLNENRSALEGTVGGLTEAATQLSSLLIDNRDPLGEDIRSLTRTFRTLSRNAKAFARTGHWAKRLFGAASRAMDYQRNWLRLGNQGGPLFELIVQRLEDRLVGVCIRLGIEECQDSRYWEDRMPNLFCVYEGACEPGDESTPGAALDKALDELSKEEGQNLRKKLRRCKKAKHPKRCRQRAKKKTEGDKLDELINDVLEGLSSTGDQVGGAL
jgi:phospholipid/cholesterol/gamma-HCH transport system substrate-binding protein